jgi:hypothetical protein
MQAKRIKNVRVLLIVTALIMSLSIPFTAVAAIPTGWKITSKKTLVPYSSMLSASTTQMSLAVAQWNNEAGTIYAISSNTHSTTGFPNLDGNNYIYKEDVGADYVARTTTWYINTTVTEADINFNVYYNFDNIGQPGCFDVYSVFLHETGHPAGLDDLYAPSDSSKVMYYASTTGTIKRALTQDDKDGIAAIYS